MKSWNNITLKDLDQLSLEIRSLLRSPCVVILSGEVGAGKTTFVKQFAGQLDICSPTYSLIAEYDDLVHADLYRIQGPNELIHLELELYLEGKDYFFIEWGRDYLTHLQSLLGDSFQYYELLISGETDPSERQFSLSKIS